MRLPTGAEAEPQPASGRIPIIDDALAAWERDMAMRRALCSKHVRKSKACVRALADAAGWRLITDCNLADAMEWLGRRRAEGWTARTHDKHVSMLRMFGKFLVGWAKKHAPGAVRENVFADLEPLGGAGGDGPRALSADELRRMVAVAQEQEARDGRAKGRRSIVYTVAALTGLRYGELRRLKWRDVFLDGDAPCVRHTAAKNGKVEPIPLNAEAVAALLLQRETGEPGEYVFRYMPSHHTVDMDMVRAGIAKMDPDGTIHKRDERGRTVSFHSTRKFTVTELRRGGTDASIRQRIARHATPDLTTGTYDDVLGPELRQAVDGLPRIFESVTAAAATTYKRPVKKSKSAVAAGGNSQHTCSSDSPMQIHQHIPRSTVAPLGEAKGSRYHSDESEGATGCAAPQGGESTPHQGSAAKWSRGESMPRPNSPAAPGLAGANGDLLRQAFMAALAAALGVFQGAGDGQQQQR